MNVKQLMLDDGTKLSLFRCAICGCVHADAQFVEACCKCQDCGATIDPKVTGSRSTLCDLCWTPHYAKRDAERLSRATEISDYAGPVVDGDRYFASLDDYVDHLDANAATWPEFVHTCHVNHYSIDIDEVLQSVIENGDAGDATPGVDDFDGLDELRAAVKVFNDKNEKLVYWDQDSKHKVRVPTRDSVSVVVEPSTSPEAESPSVVASPLTVGQSAPAEPDQTT